MRNLYRDQLTQFREYANEERGETQFRAIQLYFTYDKKLHSPFTSFSYPLYTQSWSITLWCVNCYRHSQRVILTLQSLMLYAFPFFLLFPLGRLRRIIAISSLPSEKMNPDVDLRSPMFSAKSATVSPTICLAILTRYNNPLSPLTYLRIRCVH